MVFNYIGFFDTYPYAQDYDMLVSRIAGCSVFDNYLLFNNFKPYCICRDCECNWVCQKLLNPNVVNLV